VAVYPRLDGGPGRRADRAQSRGTIRRPRLSKYPYLANTSTLAFRAHSTWH
jgi:hypothetical protein